MIAIYIIFFLFVILLASFIIWFVDNEESKRDRVNRLEDDQRYINNKRKGWDW